MLYSRHTVASFTLPGGLRAGVLAWIIAEILVFVAVVHAIGFGGAVLLGLATTILGVVMLRRIGMDAARGLRSAAEGRQLPEGAMLDGMLAALGAILLIVPGFIANFVGIGLAAPSVRGWAMRVFGGPMGTLQSARIKRRQPADVIDLAPEDWTPVEPR